MDSLESAVRLITGAVSAREHRVPRWWRDCTNERVRYSRSDIGRAPLMSDLDLLIGKWVVKVRPPGRPEPWTWEYEFKPGNVVTWQDLKGSEHGKGTWNSNSKLVNMWWEGSATRESWLRPLTPTPPPSKTWYEA